MGVIYMMMKILSSRLVIEVSACIIWVFRIKQIAHPFPPNLEDYSPALIMVGNESTIIQYYIFECLEDM